jgi:hypothetical protein
MNNAALYGGDRSLRPVNDTELIQDVADVDAHRLVRNTQNVSDLSIAVTLRETAEHFMLSVRESSEPILSDTNTQTAGGR